MKRSGIKAALSDIKRVSSFGLKPFFVLSYHFYYPIYRKKPITQSIVGGRIFMNLSILRDNVGKMDFYTKENTGENTYVGKKSSSRNKDTIEISDEAYAAQHDNQITATSGKDILGISKGDKENTFIIHFADSAMVSRAVSRGYITVNGIRIELSDEVKENLIETDKQAEADRMAAFNDYVMQHELAVAQQQREAWKKAAEESMDAFEIAAKISSGRPITSSEA